MTRKFFLCYFESTRKCNLNCSYCMTHRGIRSAQEELTTNEVKHLVLDEVKRICPTGMVAFSGGEFLLRKDALELLAYNSRLGLYAFINTNGQLLTPKLLKEIKEAANNRITFGFSLNSIDDNVHKKTRADNPQGIMQLMKMCDREKMSYFFLLTISKSNLATLNQTVEFFKEHRVPMIRSPFVPRGAGWDCSGIALDCRDMKDVVYPVLRDNFLSYISYTPFFASPEFMRKTWDQLGVPISNFGCQAGRGFIGISAEGDVAPCVHMLDSADYRLPDSTGRIKTPYAGNVRTNYLSDIMNNNPIMASLKDGSQLKGKCGRCKYKHSCSGCRATAFYHSGDYLAEDPTCFFEPVNESTSSEYEEIHNRNVTKFIEFLMHHKPWNDIFRPTSLKNKVKAVMWSLSQEK